MKTKSAFLVVALLVSFPLLAAVAPDYAMPVQHGSRAVPADPNAQALDAQTSAFMQAVAAQTSAFSEAINSDRATASPVRTGPDFRTFPNATTRVFNVTATTGNGNANSFGFIWSEVSPTTLNPEVNVNQGDDVTIKIHSANSTVHSIAMETYFPRETLVTSQTVTIHFVATDTGSFFYACLQTLCGTGHNNMFGTFIVNAAAAPPSITSISPSSGAATGGTSVTISGSNFTAPVGVTFGGVAAASVTFNSSSSVTAVTPGGTAGPVEVKLTNADATSASATFTYIAAPSITSIAPVSGTNAGGTAIVITGTGFQSGATVKLGGVAATNVSVASSTTITATTPAHATGDQSAVAVDLLVTNPDGQSATRSNAFTYNAPFVAILKANVVLVSSGPTSGGTSVTILGSGFTGGGLSVTFGGVAATSVLVVNDTTATVVTPAHGAGVVDVVVTKQGNSATAVSAFRYADGTPSGPRKHSARH
jgi:hypothetical protein